MIKETEIPIYNTKVMVIYEEDLSIMEAYCDDTFDNDAGVTIYFDANKLIVGFRPSMIKQSTITHESVHLSHRIMDNVGIPASLTNDECEAYLTGFMAHMIMEMISEEDDRQWCEQRYMKNFMI